MNRAVRILLFLMAFQMEVRVRASGDLLTEPVGCLQNENACFLQSTSIFHYEKDGLQLHADEGTALSRVDEKQWTFLKGVLWVEKGKDLRISTLYGSFSAPVGSYWLLDQGDRLLVRNMNADLSIHLRSGKTLNLPEGFEVWISGINAQGQSDYGVLRPIDMQAHLSLWNKLYRGSKEEFVAEVRRFKDNWGDLVEKSSRIYQKVIDRRLASVAEQERLIRERKAREEAENRRIKALFYQRTFER